MSGHMVLDCPVHELSVGDKQLLQPSRNWPMHQAKCYSHLKCNLRLKSGARYLLLGKNGCGKTTLMREIAAGRLEGFPEHLTTYLVDQELALDPIQTPLGAVLAADARLAALQREADALENPEPGLEDEGEEGEEGEEDAEAAMERLCAVYEEIDALGAEDEGVRARRAAAVLQGLGFDEGGLEVPIGSLSGGWKMRVALAAALFMSPHLLLLDEPTNHLDVQGIRWLQRYLAEDYHGTILCVSHDRSFIDAVATDLIIFADQALDYYNGTLSEFEEAAQERHKGLQRQVDALEKKKDHIRASVQNMEKAAAGKKATAHSKAKSGDDAKLQQVASRRKKLGRMGLEKTADGRKFNAQKHGIRTGADNNNDGGWSKGRMTAAPIVARADPALRFGFSEGAPLGVSGETSVIEMRGVGVRYPGAGADVFDGVDLALQAGCRVAIMGRNGAGKSTLAGLIAGTLDPTRGEVLRARGLRVAHYTQQCVDDLGAGPGAAGAGGAGAGAGPESTPLAYLAACYPQMREQELRALLGSFGVTANMVLQPFHTLSGGQRVRTALARLAAEGPHILLMDEPTNHLDIYSIAALQDALRAFPGGVIVISHDQSLLREVASEVLVVTRKGTGVKRFAGTVDEYLERRQKP